MSLIRYSSEAIWWWERRRINFNLILLAVGSLSTGLLVVAFPPLLMFEGGLFLIAGGVLAYGVAANICYTLGWVTELIWTKGNTELTSDIRPEVYRAGLMFSIFLTGAPAYLALVLFLVRLLAPIAVPQASPQQ